MLTRLLLFQLGCILGMGVIGPIVGAVRGRSLASVKQYSVKVRGS